MSEQKTTVSELKQLFSENRNIMAHMRQERKSTENSIEAILVSYDLQSGSYVAARNDPVYRARHDAYSAELASLVGATSPDSLLEAGIGEATTLCSVLSQMERVPSVASGFDIAWSRVHYAKRHAKSMGFPGLHLCTGDMAAMPFEDNAFDVVYTSHAVEPNHGREAAILAELYRVARHRVVLCEPSYELGGEDTRKRIEEHGYCRGLPRIAEELGAKVVLHRLFKNLVSTNNETAALVLEKESAPAHKTDSVFGCPSCRARLEKLHGQWFCGHCSLVYPVIRDIPCLLRGNGILATHFAEEN